MNEDAQEVQAQVGMIPSCEPEIKFFHYEHLPENLQEVSKPFHDLAHHIVDSLPRDAERAVALRKLLEAKDAAVRSMLSG